MNYFIRTISLVILLYLFVFALSDSNDNLLEKTKAAEDWNIHGPWIVIVEYGYNDLFVKEAHSRYQRKYYDELKMINNFHGIHFNVKHSFKDEAGLNAVVLEGLEENDLKTIKGFKSIQPDLPVFKNSEYTWGIHRITQSELTLSNPYSPAFKGCGVNVYVTDTGIDTNHIEFASVSGVSRQVTNIYNAYGSITKDTDGDGHGTHCAGTVSGNTIGVAPCSNIFGLKVLSDDGTGATSNIIAALSLIKERHIAKPGSKTVVSMSLGGPCAYKNCVDDAKIAKINEMVAVGIIFAVAAGNDAINAANDSPGSAEKAIVVAASNIFDELASYSNFGSSIDIIAPGSYINSACSKNTNKCTTESEYLSQSGTSMACPHVAGVIAQNLEKAGGYLKMTTESDVNTVMNVIKYKDAVPNKIILTSAAIGNKTVNYLLQTPKNDNIFVPLVIPTQKSTQKPTSSPNYVTTVPPVFTSQVKADTIITISLTGLTSENLKSSNYIQGLTAAIAQVYTVTGALKTEAIIMSSSVASQSLLTTSQQTILTIKNNERLEASPLQVIFSLVSYFPSNFDQTQIKSMYGAFKEISQSTVNSAIKSRLPTVQASSIQYSSVVNVNIIKPSAQPTSVPMTSPGSGSSLNSDVIIGAAVGGAVGGLLALVGGIFLYFYYCNKKKDNVYDPTSSEEHSIETIRNSPRKQSDTRDIELSLSKDVRDEIKSKSKRANSPPSREEGYERNNKSRQTSMRNDRNGVNRSAFL